MRSLILVITFVSLAWCDSVGAETGSGRLKLVGPNRFETMLSPDAPPLSTFGDDGVRVRAYPSLGGGTWMVRLNTAPSGDGEGEAIFFSRTSLRLPWERSGSVKLRVWRENWAKLTTQVDALLDEGQSPPPEKPRSDGLDEVCVTADGTDHQIERRHAGRDRWMTSERQCGRDPSEAIAQLVFTAAATKICASMQGSAPCDRDGRPPYDALAEYRGRNPR